MLAIDKKKMLFKITGRTPIESVCFCSNVSTLLSMIVGIAKIRKSLTFLVSRRLTLVRGTVLMENSHTAKMNLLSRK